MVQLVLDSVCGSSNSYDIIPCRWTGGNPFTAVSALYPPTFGEAIAFAHERYTGLFLNTHVEGKNDLAGFVAGILSRGYPTAQQLMEEAQEKTCWKTPDGCEA